MSLMVLGEGLTPWLTGAGSRRLEGTDIGHGNAEGMAYVGVRVEPTVRLGRVVEGGWIPDINEPTMSSISSTLKF